MKRTHDTLPIYEKGKSLILVKSFKGFGQQKVNLDTKDLKIAVTRTNRFLATAELNGFETALEELKGGKVLKKGTDLDFDAITKAFKEYCDQLEEPPREQTIKGYLAALKRIMGKKTLSKVDVEKWKKEFLNGSDEPARKRSMVSELRNAKAIFQESAMNFYKRKSYTVVNPFEHVEISAPKIMQYTPLPDKIRNAIDDNLDAQEPDVALICLLAFGLAFRQSEIEAARVSWFSEQKDHVIVSIHEEVGYVPKSGEKRTFKISHDLYNRLLKHRERIIEADDKLKDSEYFVPVARKKKTGKRLDRRFRQCAEWLRTIGVNRRLPLHCLRAEAGSIHLMQNKNLVETSRFLGHSDPLVTSRHYLAIIDASTVTGIVKDAPTPDPLEAAAKLLGVSVDDLKKLKKD